MLSLFKHPLRTDQSKQQFHNFLSKIHSFKIRENMWWTHTFVWLTSAYSDTRPCSLLTKILAALVFFALCSSMTAIGSFSLEINVTWVCTGDPWLMLTILVRLSNILEHLAYKISILCIVFKHDCHWIVLPRNKYYMSTGDPFFRFSKFLEHLTYAISILFMNAIGSFSLEKKTYMSIEVCFHTACTGF